MGKPYDLGRHDNVVGAFRYIRQRYVLAAVMEDRGDLQKQALSFAQSVDPLRCVEYLQAEVLDGPDVGCTGLIALCYGSGSGNDVFVERVGRFQCLVLDREIVSQPVPDGYVRKPYGR